MATINFFGLRDVLKYNRTSPYISSSEQNFVCVFANSTKGIGTFDTIVDEVPGISRRVVNAFVSTVQSTTTTTIDLGLITVFGSSPSISTFNRVIVIDSGDWGDAGTFMTQSILDGTYAQPIFTLANSGFKVRRTSRYAIPGSPSPATAYRSVPAGDVETGQITFSTSPSNSPSGATQLINAGRFTLCDLILGEPVEVTNSIGCILELPKLIIDYA